MSMLWASFWKGQGTVWAMCQVWADVIKVRIVHGRGSSGANELRAVRLFAPRHLKRPRCTPRDLHRSTQVLRAKGGKMFTKYDAATPKVGGSGGGSAHAGHRCTCNVQGMATPQWGAGVLCQETRAQLSQALVSLHVTSEHAEHSKWKTMVCQHVSMIDKESIHLE